jgi:hypothetical protein
MSTHHPCLAACEPHLFEPSATEALFPATRGRQPCCLLAHLRHRPLPASVFSELSTFKVGITCCLCTSLPLLTTSASPCGLL